MDEEDKGNTQAASSAAKSLINQANQQMPPVIAGIQGLQNTAVQRAGQTFGEALAGFEQQQQTGGYNQEQLASMRNTLASMQPTGGVDPNQLSNIRGQYSNVQNELSGYLPSGGYDPTQLAQTLGGYGAFADTGGFTPQQQQQYLNQATRGVATTAENLANAARRSAAATGSSPEAAIAAIQGEAGAQQADATNAALVGLNQQINANKLAGLGGLGTVEGQLAAARAGIMGQQAGVTGQQAGLETGVAGLRQGVSGLQQGLEGGVAQGVQAANRGIQGLYDTTTGQVTSLGNQVLAGLGLQYGTQAQGAQILQELSKNPGLFQTGFGDVLGLLGTLAQFS